MGTRPWPATGPALLFSNRISSNDLRNRVALVPLQALEGPRWLTRLACQRLDYAGGRGICLGEGGGTAALQDEVLSTHAYVFGPDLRIRHDLSVGGFPSRVRISPDGRYGSVTVFIAGHSYAEAAFSTATTLIDLDRGVKIGNLETFTVIRNGTPFRSVDFNFWGVTFARDSDRFYATLGTGNRTYLVEGSIRSRRLQTVRENVECPSLSPDGKRLAFKKRVGASQGVTWRFHVLDLTTMTETPLAEPRSLDDQIEWLDDRQVVYGDGRNVWSVPADGSGKPAKVLSQASSPTVLAAPLPSGTADAGPGLPGGNSVALRGTDLAVAVTGAPPQASVGSQIPYVVSITNRGPDDATDLVVDQILSDGLTVRGPPTATNPANGYGCSVHDGERHISCDTILLPAGTTWTITLNVTAAAAGTQALEVVVSGGQPDPRAENDRVETRTNVR
jgi:uncharacterized repeat protein (TIGR01451 family)